jgi:Putative Ig domain
MRRILLAVAAISSMALISVAASPAALAKTHHVKSHGGDPTIYDSTISPLPGSLESTSFEANEDSEVGNQITFAGTARVLDNVVATLDSFACQTGSGYSTSCSTTPGATFTEPVTLNIYKVGAHNAVGSLIVSDTQTFNIPYQPSADQNYTTDCAPDVVPNTYFSNVSDFAGAWYDANEDPVTGNPIGCEFGFAANFTFHFDDVLLPNSVIYGIAYDTSNYGDSPQAPQYQVGGSTPTGAPWGTNTACAIAGNCPYDSLNVANSISPPSPTVGSDPNLGTAYLDSDYAPYYCDNGAGGTGTFRIDGRPDTENCTGTGSAYEVGYTYAMSQGLCDANGAEDQGDTVAQVWALNGNTGDCTLSPYVIPSVQFNAVANAGPSFTTGNSASATNGQSFTFTVSTDGYPTPTLSKRSGRLPSGLTFTPGSNGTATISGTPTVRHPHVYHITIKAANAYGIAKQAFSLTVNG